MKGGEDYHSIVLVEVIWKAVAVIAITYHNFLHGFRIGRSTATATLEVKLLRQVAALREAVLHAIFLDLHKTYDALDRSRCLGILEVYGVGHRSLRLLQTCWERLRMVARAVGY